MYIHWFCLCNAMNMKWKWIIASSIFFSIWACNTYTELPIWTATDIWKTERLVATPQQQDGDPDKGYQYMLSGEYVGSGIPYDLFESRGKKLVEKMGTANPSNPDVPYLMSVFTTKSGVEVVSGNCFTCHAAPMGDSVVLGIGNFASDYRANLSGFFGVMDKVVRFKYGKESEEKNTFDDFNRYLQAISPAIATNQIGPNPAARLAEACMQHRDLEDLTYTANDQYSTDAYNIGSDVPPLWHVKKKNALYYTGVGKGDFTKLLMQASVLGISDSTEAREIQKNFVDVLAWLQQLEPPAYPYDIDTRLAKKGQAIFEEHCSGCHGTYGEQETYPNKIVSVDVVKTDTLYAAYAMTSPITDWYNDSWFATSAPQSSLSPHYGYVAPPLDGIWATAPYLHNGAVPTLETLLNSEARPTFWKRNIENYDFDEVEVGHQYEAKDGSFGKATYDTTLPGYSNVGHYFGDKLSAKERKAVIEYLKGL
jgi:mono/diheme cytochrome c family protein